MAELPGGAGTNLANTITNFSQTNNYMGVNLGQLKNLAQPFYDRLIDEGYTNAYPWTAATTDDVDYASANIGQVKHLFSFDLTVDCDSDSLSGWWELEHFGDLGQTGSGDSDGDGYTNSQEYSGGTDPNSSDADSDGVSDSDDSNPASSTDSDADGLPDDWENHWFGDLDETAAADYDGDGNTNLQEYQMGTDPTKSNVDDTDNTLNLTIYRPVE